MANTKERKFKRLKNQHTVASIIVFVVAMIVLTVVINAIIAGFSLYAIDSKIDSEYKTVRFMADTYESDPEKGKEKVLDIFKNYSFIVRDKEGREIDEYGVNTCGDVGGHTRLFGESEYEVYEDLEDKNIVYSGIGAMVLNVGDLDLSGDDISISVSGADSEDQELNVEASGQIDMPVWIAVKLKNGGSFVAKGHVRTKATELVVLLVLIIALNAFAIIFLIIRLIRIVRAFARRKNITELFLIDDVTKGNNWMGFMMKADAILKKGKNADKRYAIIHLVIVKYRNYCMCHSMEEGKRILYRISSVIDQCLIKKEEVSAHVSSSSFVILMEAPNDDIVRNRFRAMLERLSTVDTTGNTQQMAGHPDVFRTFTFQAGAQIIEPNIVEGKKQRRRDTELERYYNNAVTAKATLESASDSGIAFFDDKLMENEKWTELVEEHQQKALDNEEFIVFYQPKYSPDKAELVGAEALVRWQSPEFGFVPPGRFIPIFETNGFVTAIDHYMICHVAQDQKRWLDAGMKCVPVSVNVSRAHFAESDLAEQIKNMVDEVGTPHELIEIELTESAFFDDKDAIIQIIERLKEYGFSVSMDDFGSGYSSLNSLKDMDLDVLKLDAEFFRGNADEERKEAVVSEAIKLAKRLNMRTVAEGVEAKEEVEFLERQGCDMIQGYYFAKPMPKDEYEERMKEVYHDPEKE